MVRRTFGVQVLDRASMASTRSPARAPFTEARRGEARLERERGGVREGVAV